MSNYRIPGSRDLAATTPYRYKNDYLGVGIEPYLATRVDSVRGQVESVDSPRTSDDDVVKITLDAGIELWTSVGQARADYGMAPGARGIEGNLIVPRILPIGRAERGVGQWVVKALELFKVDLADSAASAIVATLERKFEARLGIGGPGLYRFDQNTAKPVAEADFAEAMAGGPSLVFVHGTASCSEGGFGRFRERAAWSELFKLYNNRVFAFEHRTLSQNPIANAIQLATAIPKGAEIDLISHSRGGLVCELICRSARIDASNTPIPAFDDADSDIFQRQRAASGMEDAAAVAEIERRQLTELSALLQAKKFTVRHLVRAAAPSRGTTLASGRLDRYLSLVVSAMNLIPALAGNPVFDLTMGLLLAVAKKRTDPREIPGLEAQMPESPFIRMVNRADVMLLNRLTVIAGDIEGSGIWGRLKVLATDLFYLDDHDLVVNTSAMYGGAERKAGAVALFDQGAAVNHFSYFANEKTARGILDALNLRTAESDGFRPFTHVTQRVAPTRSAGAARSGSAPLVYVVPGAMGTELDSDGKSVWLNLLRIATGGLSRISWDQKKVTSSGLFDDYYAELVDYLTASHEVIAFDYDWRASLQTEAARLANSILPHMEHTNQPIRFIAHSQGGLLVRAMAARNPDLWQRIMQNPGARFVMLGMPNMGAFSTLATLLGRDKIIRQIELIDFKHNMKELLQIVSAFPGVLELLPRDNNGQFYSADTWAKIMAGDWNAPAASALTDADAIWKSLEAFSMAGKNLAYVAGYSPALTPSAARIDKDGSITILGTPQGDGRVPWTTGIPPGVPAWFTEAAHGDLARFTKAFPAYLDLLSTGQTTKLASTPPAGTRGAITALEEIKPERIEIYPSERDLADGVMGAGPTAKVETESSGKIKVTLVHGDLAFALYPVIVGHYEADTIRAAEGALNRHLDFRLSRKRALGLYPGPITSAELIADDQGRPPGALVIGLGRFGELTPSGLRRSFAYGIKKYADISTDGKTGVASINLSTLLIGHRESHLSLRDSIVATIDGLIDARKDLANQIQFKDVVIAEFEIIELYEDTAIGALRILRSLKDDPRIKPYLDIDLSLKTAGGRRRRITADDETEWARKIQIRGKDSDGRKTSLTFTALGDSARATEVSLATQVALIDPYLRSLTASTAVDMETSKTLFELLTPKEFKLRAAEGRDTVLILDEAAAAYPWELLSDRFSGDAVPMVVRSSCIRQLIDAKPTFYTSLSRDQSAVVIGDSVSELDTGFAPLPGAQEEAQAVAALLKAPGAGFTVTEVIKGSCAAISNALLLTGARVMHVAAHGVYEFERLSADGAKDLVTGMVLGDGAFFTASEVDQIRPFPELVFLNCCFLGKIAPTREDDLKLWNDRHRLAGNLAHQFIRNGAKAVVAAGWAVNDAAALVFAKSFYTSMLAGATFNVAVKGARKATYDADSNCNTWGAYQCYGDPDYRLVPNGASEAYVAQNLMSRGEALIELENLSSSSATASAKKLDDSRRAIDNLLNRMDPRWLKASTIQEGLARAYAKADLLEKAILSYETALASSDAQSTLQAIEQLANLRARKVTAQLHSLTGVERDEFRKKAPNELKKAIKQIDALRDALQRSGIAVADSAERFTLIASAKKRIGAISSGSQRVKWLKEAAKTYECAYDITASPDSGQSNLYYPGLNWLMLEALANLNKPAADRVAPTPEQAARLKFCRENAEAEDRSGPDFYSLNAQFDAVVVEGLLGGTLAAQTDTAIGLFKRAWRRGGSYLELRAVRDQLDFIEDCLDGISDWPKNENLRESLLVIRSQIELVLAD